MVLHTQPAAPPKRAKPRKPETEEDLYCPDVDCCQFCEEPIQICTWEVVKDDLSRILRDGTLFKHWSGPLPFGPPTAKYYRWAAFEYWISNTYNALKPKTSGEPIPMCVRLGVCNDWYPESWKDDDECIVGESAFQRINSNGIQRAAQHAASAAIPVPRIRRMVKFDCTNNETNKKKSNRRPK